MRFVWLAFVGLIAAMALLIPRLNRPSAPPAPAASPSFATLRTASAGRAGRGDSIVAFGLAQRGTPYVYAGTSPLTGFDCSGFIMFTFAHFGVAVPHSTALLIDVGRPVARTEAQPGDIVVFTGTTATSTTPGHAGIVISGRGEVPLRFVHASSARRESGVKVSQVEGTDYERRFMQVRRVLGPGMVAVARATAVARPQIALPVVALPSRPVAIESEETPAAAPPAKLAPLKLPARHSRKSTPAVKKAALGMKRTIPHKALAKRVKAKEKDVTKPAKVKEKVVSRPR